VEDDVHLVERGERLLDHVLVERAAAGVDPGRIDEDDLRLRLGDVANADDAVARRLGLRRDDGDLLTEEAIEKRRLADVGSPDDGAKASTMRRHGGFIIMVWRRVLSSRHG